MDQVEPIFRASKLIRNGQGECCFSEPCAAIQQESIRMRV